MNSLHKNLVRLFTICFLQVVLVSFALACMCPSGNSVRAEFDKSTNVIIAKLETYEPIKIILEENKMEISLPTDRHLPKLKVQKVLKGNFQVGEVLNFDGVYRCSLWFAEVGGNYLLYLGDRPKQDELWQAPSCSKSGLLENSLADLLYISKEKKVRKKTRLAGRLFYDKDSISKKDKSQLPILTNRKVYFVGEKRRFEARTDKNGVYEIYDLPVGTYKIFSENIIGWNSKVSNYDSDIVEIAKSGQYERDFKYKTISLVSEKGFDVSELTARTCLEPKLIGIKNREKIK